MEIKNDDIFDMPDIGGVEWDADAFDANLVDFIQEEEIEETRYLKPKVLPFKEQFVTYDNAQKLARDIEITNGSRYDVLVNGTFIFGDFIEAFIVKNNCYCQRLLITTLSMSQENIDSLHNLIVAGYIGKLDIIVSHYFWSNERNQLLPYMLYKLDIDNRFQLAVAASHTKTAQIQTLGGKKIVMHGSANLRSSANIEQFTIEENAELYDFYEEKFDAVIEKYKTINKTCSKHELWKIISTKHFKNY